MDLYGDIDGVDIAGGRTPAIIVKAAGNIQNLEQAQQIQKGVAKNKDESQGISTQKKSSSGAFSMTFKPRQTAVSKEILYVPSIPRKPNTTQSISSNATLQSTSAPIAPQAAPTTTATAFSIEMGSFDVPDPYDPSRPNDYLQYCEERRERKRLRLLQEDNEKILQEREAERVRLEMERAEALKRGDVNRIEASLGASRGRGRLSNLPAWMSADQL